MAGSLTQGAPDCCTPQEPLPHLQSAGFCALSSAQKRCWLCLGRHHLARATHPPRTACLLACLPPRRQTFEVHQTQAEWAFGTAYEPRAVRALCAAQTCLRPQGRQWGLAWTGQRRRVAPAGAGGGCKLYVWVGTCMYNMPASSSHPTRSSLHTLHAGTPLHPVILRGAPPCPSPPLAYPHTRPGVRPPPPGTHSSRTRPTPHGCSQQPRRRSTRSCPRTASSGPCTSRPAGRTTSRTTTSSESPTSRRCALPWPAHA